MGDLVAINTPTALKRRDTKYLIGKGPTGYLIRICTARYPYLSHPGNICYKPILILEYFEEDLILLDLDTVKQLLKDDVKYYTETEHVDLPKNYTAFTCLYELLHVLELSPPPPLTVPEFNFINSKMTLFNYKNVELRARLKLEGDYISLKKFLCRSLTLVHNVEDSKWSSYFYAGDSDKFVSDRFLEEIHKAWLTYNFGNSSAARRGVDQFLSSMVQWRIKSKK